VRAIRVGLDAGVAGSGAHRGRDAIDQRVMDPTLGNVGDPV
jgi:hypothetical protein